MTLPLNDLDLKAKQVLGVHAVSKALAQEAAFARLPRYVAEYLLAKFVKPETWQEDLARVRAKIRGMMPELDQRELFKERLLTAGKLTIIDFLEARVDLRAGLRLVSIPSLQDRNVHASTELLRKNEGLYTGGMWGTASIEIGPEEPTGGNLTLTDFVPFQIGPPDVEQFKTFRKAFTSDEWLELVLTSVGYRPSAFPDRRTRLLLLARLVPLVERNYNLLELGPRQTGKTFLLRNLSPGVYCLSGGTATPANLFVNLATKELGIIGSRRVVIFDEIAHADFGRIEETLSILKDYMESGQYARGKHAYAADASLVFSGNLEVQDGVPHPKYRHLLEPLPTELIDSAFIDRIHAFLPGWEIPKIGPDSLAEGVGFVSDYFGEVLLALRNDSFADQVRPLTVRPGLTRRDQKAMERTASGMMKILYPDGIATPAEVSEIVTFASELRERVHRQLCRIAPGEFKQRPIDSAGQKPIDF